MWRRHRAWLVGFLQTNTNRGSLRTFFYHTRVDLLLVGKNAREKRGERGRESREMARERQRDKAAVPEKEWGRRRRKQRTLRSQHRSQ